MNKVGGLCILLKNKSRELPARPTRPEVPTSYQNPRRLPIRDRIKDCRVRSTYEVANLLHLQPVRTRMNP